MENKILILVTCILISMTVSGQDRVYRDDHVYNVLEKSAEPKIGFKAFVYSIRESLVYPVGKREVEGTVFVRMIIERDSTCTHLKIIKGIGKSLTKKRSER